MLGAFGWITELFLGLLFPLKKEVISVVLVKLYENKMECGFKGENILFIHFWKTNVVWYTCAALCSTYIKLYMLSLLFYRSSIFMVHLLILSYSYDSDDLLRHAYYFRCCILMTSTFILPTLTSLLRSGSVVPASYWTCPHARLNTSKWPLLKLKSHLGTIMLRLQVVSFSLSSWEFWIQFFSVFFFFFFLPFACLLLVTRLFRLCFLKTSWIQPLLIFLSYSQSSGSHQVLLRLRHNGFLKNLFLRGNNRCKYH